jgi:hypothetical protein
MSRQSSGSPTPDDAAWPDDYDPRYQRPGQPPRWPGQGGPPPRRSGRGLIIAAAAVVAAVVGAGAALAVKEWPSSSPPAASSNSLPNGQSGAGAGAGAGGGAEQGQYLHIVMEGKVTAISSNSITIQGSEHTVTASITSATKITGSASSVSAIKVGDDVSAEITRSGGQTVVDALQYPPNPPNVG